ncbi:MAG TPA: carbon monoxide dehydrogenase subunit G [Anaerolineales bacterium]|nr:carbon monoxide dehydrogenase subunit G [Anaerolineales bacterium]
MLIEGIVNINAPRDRVWKSLTDAEFVAQCAPGVKSMEVVVPNQKFQVVAVVGFGSVSSEFRTDVEFLELVEPDSATIKAHGSGSGSAVDVTAKMELSDAPGGATQLKWTADITIVGTIASLASRLMAPVTKKMTGVFFDCVKAKLEA